jgi:hypothetical protein
LIGISGAPALVDGGYVTVPTLRMYDPKGTWLAEGHGVEPDIAVTEDPTALAKGTDPQFDRAIKEVTDRMAKQPATPPRPAYEKRVPGGGKLRRELLVTEQRRLDGLLELGHAGGIDLQRLEISVMVEVDLIVHNKSPHPGRANGKVGVGDFSLNSYDLHTVAGRNRP